MNVFYFLTYEGGCDLSQLPSSTREAFVEQAKIIPLSFHFGRVCVSV